MNRITLRLMNEHDSEMISNAFSEQGWNKPAEKYVRYVKEQNNGERVSLVAEYDGDFAGYVNVIWKSYYPPFRERGIPEINDFNVLIKYRRRGIGAKLMDRAEDIIGERTNIAGIGFGLYSDYGPAQILYARRGYIPDGNGIYRNEHRVEPGQSVVIDDDVVLYLTKKLK
ncbi:GNAT family N-acetyltransferase [Paenibacillus alkalitolerans]|uniref:GNAT family N-acetyltransferase n=1 Tax=Paenibacillus alkalitolerans TaxID=2799335 RepID=UPI0018F6AAB6|nr:GNAT family N-acetyltransferase [Paenibacillus alkalitolerans]